MQSINHVGFIAAAYAAAIVASPGLSAWVMIDYRLLRRRLLDLDAQGIARRSAAKRGEAAAGSPGEAAAAPAKEEA